MEPNPSRETLDRLESAALIARDAGILGVTLTPSLVLLLISDLRQQRANSAMYDAREADLRRILGVESVKWDDIVEEVQAGQKARAAARDLRASIAVQIGAMAERVNVTDPAAFDYSACRAMFATLSQLAADVKHGTTTILPRTPANGDRLDSFTAAELDALPVGSSFPSTASKSKVTKTPRGWFCDCEEGCRLSGTTSAQVLAALEGDRTLVLPTAEARAPKRTPKNGDRLDLFTAAELDALPEGARFHPNNPMAGVVTKGPDGWHSEDSGKVYASTGMIRSFDGGRTLVLPDSAVLPALGTLLRDVTDAQLDALPVGSRFEDATEPDDSDYRHIEKQADGWRISGRKRATWIQNWTEDPYQLERIGPAPETKPAPAKVGDPLSAYDDARLATLPVGSVFTSAHPDYWPIRKVSADLWRAEDPAGRCSLDINDIDPMDIRRLPDLGYTLTRIGPFAPAKVGDRWGDLTAEQRAGLPVGAIVEWVNVAESRSGAIAKVATDMWRRIGDRADETAPDCRIGGDVRIIHIPGGAR